VTVVTGNKKCTRLVQEYLTSYKTKAKLEYNIVLRHPVALCILN
jgi:hypothetical protein